jgi:AraC family transcriptional regulator
MMRMESCRTEIQVAPPPHERSRLSDEQLGRWSGLHLGYFDANPDIVLNCNGAVTPLLCMLESGRGMFEIGGKVLELEPGAAGLFVPDTCAARKRLRCTPGRRIAVELDLGLPSIHGLLDDDLVTPKLRPDPEFYDRELAAVLRAMAAEVAQGCPNGRLLAESLSLGVMMRLSRTHAAQPITSRERGRLSPSQMNRLDELLELELANDVSLADLAAAAGFSKPHFTRLFKNTVGVSPHRYIMRKRVELARSLLVGSNQPLAEIAVQSGFANQSHMTVAFTRDLGATPGEVRRAARHGNAF